MLNFLESITQLAELNSDIDLIQTAVAFAIARGFAGVFLISPIGRDSRVGRALTSHGFDDIWARAYRRWLHRTDPFPEIVLNRPQPFRWSEAGRLRQLTGTEQRYLNILAKRGMGDGLIIPVFGPTARCGIIGLGLHPGLDTVTEQDLLELRLYFQAGYQRYCELITPDFAHDRILSQREMDVLKWMSRGKSNAAIGIILDIAADTVDTYVRRIYKKLGVSDRAAAMVAAVRHGYILAANYPRPQVFNQAA